MKKFVILLLSPLLLQCRVHTAGFSPFHGLEGLNYQINRKVLLGPDSVMLFIALYKTATIQSDYDFLNHYAVSGQIGEEYSNGKVVTLRHVAVTPDKTWNAGKQLIFSFKIPVRNSNHVFFFKIENTRSREFFLVDMGRIFRPDARKNFLMRDESLDPVVSDFYPILTGFEWETTDKRESPDSLHLAFYRENFRAALPPCIIRSDSANLYEFLPDSIAFLALNTMSLIPQSGLAVFSSLKSSVPDYSGCFAMLFTPQDFPEITYAEQLIPPLVYITSEQEFQALDTIQDPKAAADNFWLKAGGTYYYSKRLIQDYYSRVEYANRYFTSYKEGWKTDKGMIYIVFGKPDLIVDFGNTQEWHYDNLLNLNFYTFTFEKKKILFSDNHYELLRDPAYEKPWELAVEKWRKGIIVK